MTTYLYCVGSDQGALPRDVRGLDGGVVHALETDGLTAWVSAFDGPTEPTVERLRAHDAVCAAAMDAGETPLPIRFGQTFADDGAVLAAIAERATTIRTRLSRVAGCAEMRVVVMRGDEADVNAAAQGDPSAPEVESEESVAMGPGTAFLQRLARAGRADLAREIGCEEARHVVRSTASSLVVDQHRCESARGMAFFPVLVRRSDVDAFRSAVTAAMSARRIDLSVLGPFAPYSFSGDA